MCLPLGHSQHLSLCFLPQRWGAEGEEAARLLTDVNARQLLTSATWEMKTLLPAAMSAAGDAARPASQALLARDLAG